VLTACADAIPQRQFSALLADLAEQLAEDGMDKRVRMVARTLKQPNQAREVLRVAALVAHISEGVSEVERQVMLGLARACNLTPAAVDEAVDAAEQALAQ
jgi:tellurite resistance protein